MKKFKLNNFFWNEKASMVWFLMIWFEIKILTIAAASETWNYDLILLVHFSMKRIGLFAIYFVHLLLCEEWKQVYSILL